MGADYAGAGAGCQACSSSRDENVEKTHRRRTSSTEASFSSPLRTGLASGNLNHPKGPRPCRKPAPGHLPRQAARVGDGQAPGPCRTAVALAAVSRGASGPPAADGRPWSWAAPVHCPAPPGRRGARLRHQPGSCGAGPEDGPWWWPGTGTPGCRRCSTARSPCGSRAAGAGARERGTQTRAGGAAAGAGAAGRPGPPRLRSRNLRSVSCRNDSIFDVSRPRTKFHRMRNTRPGRNRKLFR